MRVRILFGLAATLALPAPFAAQPMVTDSGFQLRVNGDVAVSREDREGGAVVVRGDAVVHGRLGVLVVVDGTARIAGGRVGDLTVIRGRAELSEGAVVERELHLLDAELSTADSARVLGTIERGAGRKIARDLIGLTTLFGLGLLTVLVVGGVFVATLAPHQLRSVGRLMELSVAQTAGAALLLWVGAPLVAVLLVPTIIGAPAGLGFFIFILPVAWYAGVIVAGTWLGDQLLGRLRRRVEASRPYLAAIVGITVLLVVGRLPVLNVVAFIATAMGSGAVALACWRSIASSARTPRMAPAASHS